MHTQRLSPRTIEHRTQFLHKFLRETGIQPRSATTLDIAKWIASHDDWADSTTGRYFYTLNAFYKFLQLHDYRTDNPMMKLRAPHAGETEPRPTSDGDLVRMLKTPMNRRTRVMILLAALAGMRAHEIAKVRTRDIDFSAQRIMITGKGKKTKSVPLNPILAEYARQMPETGWWFPGRKPGTHMLSKSVSGTVAGVMRRAGVSGRCHSLRRWFATTMHQDGASMLTIRDALRHSNIATTQIYTKGSNKMVTDAVNQLDPWRGARSEAA